LEILSRNFGNISKSLEVITSIIFIQVTDIPGSRVKKQDIFSEHNA